MASNDSTLQDGFGADSDWIEIQNAGDTAVDLRGYHLTDRAGNLAKWTFDTSTVLQPSEFLVVFASGRDTVDPSGNLHTNFKLSSGGEYLALTSPDATVLSEYGPNGTDYSPQLTDTSFGLGQPTLLADDTLVDYLASPGSDVGNAWTQPGFDASANGFSSGPAAIGYEQQTGGLYTDLIRTPISSGTSSVYIRHEFELTDASKVSELNLNLKLDDGVVVYLNGQSVLSVRAPASPDWNSVATTGINDFLVLAGTDYAISTPEGLLHNGTNVLAMHLLNTSSSSSDLLIVPTLTATGVGAVSGYLATPTPGSSNSELYAQGPLLRTVEATPAVPVAGQPLVIEAEIVPFRDPLDFSTVSMTYRHMFANPVTLAMRDDGQGADTAADDGVFTATIPGSAVVAGEMIRWFVTVGDTGGRTSRAPQFRDPLDSAEYFGAVAPDPTASTDVPVIHLFVQDTAAIETNAGTRASMLFRGTFYDNIHVDVHGQSSRSFPKKSMDLDANTGEKFDIADGVGKASDFNLLTNYGDQTKVRHPLAYDVFREAGTPSSLAYTVSVHRNGQFYGLFDFVEEGDEEQLERFGFDPDNSLYKVNNDLTSATNQVEQKAGVTTGDFQEVVDGNALGNNHNTATDNWDWDHLDMADIVNYVAVQTLIQNLDYGHKNMYWYHDNSGTQLWSVLPWDTDLSFGHRWNSTDGYFDNNLITSALVGLGNNDLFQRLNSNSEFNQMYKRRLRTLMDQFLGPTGTDIADSWLYQQMLGRRAVLADEMQADAAAWPNTTLVPGFPNAYPYTPWQAVQQQLTVWLPTRRSTLEAVASIPDAHSDTSDVQIGTNDYAPLSGDLNEQYLVISNHEDFAVDISGWTLAGSITHTFKPGTVIAANDELYLTANVQGFLARTTGPRGSQQRFVQASGSGSWNQGSGLMDLLNPDGAIIDSARYGVSADFNNDGVLDCADVDPLSLDAATQTYRADFDLNADGVVNRADVDLWRFQAGHTNLGAGHVYRAGDANLDNLVDEDDFVLWRTSLFTSGSSWCKADFNTDGVTDVSDFNLWNARKFTANVPATIANASSPIRIPRAAPPPVVVDTVLAVNSVSPDRAFDDSEEEDSELPPWWNEDLLFGPTDPLL